MQSFLVTLALASSAQALVRTEESSVFYNFVREFKKVYTEKDLPVRFAIFKANLAFIAEHNAQNHSYTVGVNQFADLTTAEFAQFNGLVANPDHGKNGLWAPQTATLAAAAVDWVAKGAVTPVKDQGQCGSCWAFSAVGAIEGAHQIAGGALTQFSEQQLVSCSVSYGNLGCNGGLMDSAFQYVEKNGLCTETDYPYTAKSDFLHCRSSSCATAVKVGAYTDVTPNNEAALLAAATAAPVSVAIEADTQVFQLYTGGVFDNAGCGKNLDHGVLIVGYGTDAGADYWNVKNSWGSSWGEAGYIRLVRGKDMCGINTQPSFPTNVN